ncbi:cytochrome c, partial [Acidisphaera sp. L21]|uniref:c-type cytochrome n=1 Tax=Acidisphaera sp. L21 TaxID=1641851 RepID=UPI001576EE15
QTPFGPIFAPNITPDRDSGIGTYSFAAFQRAMREGVARDGRNLYPAFPYTAFSKMTDGDLLALYAYLMAQTPVKATTTPTRLAFPFNVRPLLAGWNLLFNRSGVIEADPAQSAQWNRGNYLVNAVAHCGACHTPRNMLGAERQAAYLDGALVDGWEAPALSELSRAPVPWTQDALYEYLRHGIAAEHGAVAGPMGPVVASLAELPDSDIAAMAHYVASLTPRAIPVDVAPLVAASWRDLGADATEGARLFAGACQSCHHDGNGPPVFGANIPLALNSNLYSDRPDNLLRTILDGIAEPARPGLGPMPGFRDSMNDQQVAELARFLRQRFAPARPAWQGIEQAVARARQLATAP